MQVSVWLMRSFGLGVNLIVLYDLGKMERGGGREHSKGSSDLGRVRCF